jgi:hypothetical protein
MRRLFVTLIIVAGNLCTHCGSTPYRGEALDVADDERGGSARGPVIATPDGGLVFGDEQRLVPADAGLAPDAGMETGGAKQHLDANLAVRWTWPGGGMWNVDQTIEIASRGRSTFHAHQVAFSGTNDVAYVGIQTDGTRFDGTTGDTAIFSVWNATAADGAGCRTFAGEGTGFSCRLAIAIGANEPRKVRLWRLGGDASGQWWGAWIIDKDGLETSIGSIRAPAAATLITSSVSFVEYFGPEVSCDGVPLSMATFRAPSANFGGSAYALTASYAGASRGACTGGTATAGANGVTVAFGGSR